MVRPNARCHEEIEQVQTITRMRRAKLRRTSASKWRARAVVATEHAPAGIVVRAAEDAPASV